jgi:hypothetical protein
MEALDAMRVAMREIEVLGFVTANTYRRMQSKVARVATKKG